MNFNFPKIDSFDLDNLEDLLSTQVVDLDDNENPKSPSSIPVNNDSIDEQSQTTAKETPKIEPITSFSSLHTKAANVREETAEVENNASDRDVVSFFSNSINNSNQNKVNSITEAEIEEEENNFKSNIFISDSDLVESNSEGNTLVTVNTDNIEKNTVVSKQESKENSVVFMGWRNESSGSVISDITSVGGSRKTNNNERRRCLSSSSAKSGNKNQLQNTFNRLARNRTFSGSEKSTKNLWKGVLALTQRSPIHKKGSGRKEQLFDSLDEFDCEQNSSDDENVSSHRNASVIDVHGSSKYIAVGINDDYESGQNDSESLSSVIYEKGEGDDIYSDRSPSDDCNSEHGKAAPVSPPYLDFKSRNDDDTANAFPTTGVAPTTPVNERKKKFARKMKIQPKGGKIKRTVGLQSSLMTEDTLMQKEFVQIQPFYAYPESFQMSDAEIYQEMMRKSTNVENLISSQLCKDTKSDKNSQIGSLQVEVLACMGLPQFGRNKPNPITYLVCGDNAFATDIINSSRTPMWPARSKRAALFPLFHAYAVLYAGVFNVTDKDNDDYVGRIAIDISTLRPNVDYDISIPLRKSGSIYNKQPRGLIRLRICLEWKTERAAILSYLPSTLRKIFTNLEEHHDLVTIPCGDSKSIRNIAFTIYGEDLPGKYSKKSFRAINRELNLYKFQIPIVLKITLFKLMSYQIPFVSMYIYIGWMAILHFNAYHLVPSYIVSIMMVFHLNKHHEVASKKFISSGFEPMSLQDILHSLIKNEPRDNENCSKLSFTECHDMESYLNVVGNKHISTEDHVEFPFSESKYARRSLKSMLCPKVSLKKRVEEAFNESIETVDKEPSESDNESVHEVEIKSQEKVSSLHAIPSGPEQNDSIETRESTFQENVKQIEDMFHSLTFDLFHQQVSRLVPMPRSDGIIDDSDQGIPGIQANKFTNPLSVLSAAFLEPVMNVINVYLLTVRSVFNIVHWRDPYLSFWFLVFLTLVTIFLAIFPWKSFFFLSGCVCFGPQNYFLMNNMFIRREVFGLDNLDEMYSEDEHLADDRRGNKLKLRFRQKSDNTSVEKLDYDRNLFSTQHGMKFNKKKNATPLEVVVPYTRSRRERFYFWPPLNLLLSNEQEAAFYEAGMSAMKKTV